jgi:hypothetical protein
MIWLPGMPISIAYSRIAIASVLWLATIAIGVQIKELAAMPQLLSVPV